MERECYNTSPTRRKKGEALMVKNLDMRNELREERVEPVEYLIGIRLREDEFGKAIRIGSTFLDKVRVCLLELLRKNKNIFAWIVVDMTGIDLRVIIHCLNVDPTYKLIRQKKRLFAIKRQKTIDEEVNKLLDATFIKEA